MKPTSPLPRLLRRCIFILLYLLPAVLFCSYHPVIRLGSNASMNFELSLPLIWLIIFDLAAATGLFYLGSKNPHRRSNTRATQPPTSLRLSMSSDQNRLQTKQFPGISDRKFFLFALFPLFATISIFWSPNPIRGILTAGIIWLIFFAVFAIIYLIPLFSPPQDFRRNILISLLLSTVLVCLFCWIQCFLDLCALSRDATLLCLGCTYRSFGFPHPSGLAIEPQFMGNLLLAPTLTALYLLVFRRPKSRRTRFALLSLACFFSATLFLTFSRGAIYAYIIALIIMLGFALFRSSPRRSLSLILIPLITFLFTLVAQGTFAALSPTPDTFISGITKSLHQLSLGLVDLRPATSTPNDSTPLPSETSSAPTSASSAVTPPDSQAQVTPPASTFDGYVAESTNIRLDLNATAIDTWLSSPRNIAIGVGLGGAGTVMHALYPDRVTSPKEIVQNQAFSLLVELGLIGIFLALFGLIIAFFAPFLPRWLIGSREDRSHSFWSYPALSLLVCVICAYLITLNFFSGLPNALHIYLLPPLLYLIFSDHIASAKHKTPKSR